MQEDSFLSSLPPSPVWSPMRSHSDFMLTPTTAQVLMDVRGDEQSKHCLPGPGVCSWVSVGGLLSQGTHTPAEFPFRNLLTNSTARSLTALDEQGFVGVLTKSFTNEAISSPV